MDLKKEDQKAIEERAGDLDQAIDEVAKNPKSIKAWIKLLIAIGSFAVTLIWILKALGVI